MATGTRGSWSGGAGCTGGRDHPGPARRPPDVRSLASGLSVAAQQAVEIAKAISLDVRVLIMDEPTAALSAHGDRLFRQVRHLTASGVAVLFISHHLDEVFEIADRVTVLRDGRRISSRPRDEVTPTGDPGHGRPEMSEFFANRTSPGRPGHPRLRDREDRRLRGRELRGPQGGGAGPRRPGRRRRTDVALALFGIAPAESGSVELDGRPVVIRSPREALRQGIAYLSEDRRQLGLSLPQSLTANITLATLDRYVTRLRLVDSSAERAVADGSGAASASARPRWRRRSSGCRAATSRRPCSPSGSTPSRRAHPRRAHPRDRRRRQGRGPYIIDELARSGMAIILISSDLPEVLAMSDRILVMREGRQVGMFGRSEATEEGIVTAAMGPHEPAAEGAARNGCGSCRCWPSSRSRSSSSASSSTTT